MTNGETPVNDASTTNPSNPKQDASRYNYIHENCGLLLVFIAFFLTSSCLHSYTELVKPITQTEIENNKINIFDLLNAKRTPGTVATELYDRIYCEIHNRFYLDDDEKLPLGLKPLNWSHFWVGFTLAIILISIGIGANANRVNNCETRTQITMGIGIFSLALIFIHFIVMLLAAVFIILLVFLIIYSFQGG